MDDAGLDLPPELAALRAAVGSWRELGARYGEQLRALESGAGEGRAVAERAAAIDLLLELGDRQGAWQAALAWLGQALKAMPRRGRPEEVLPVELLRCLAEVVERSGDQVLLELLWQGLERLAPPLPPAGVLPLVGVPVLNRPDLLERLLASLDVPVGTLAIVDNSGGRHDADALELRRLLERLEREGCRGVGRVRVARAFGNGGVAAAWNQILLGFPEAALALIVGNDVVLAPGVLAQALERLDPERPQFLSLLPGGDAFSAFLITALAWDRLGLFDASFHPAYCEDLDYRDRLQGCPEVAWLDGGFAHGAMAALNPERSATIGSDPALERANRRTFQLNRLWYLYRRRPPVGGRGHWRRRWLAGWT